MTAPRPRDVAAHYDAEAEAYASPVPTEHLDEFLALLPPRGRVLEVGCGPGDDAARVAGEGFRVTGLDLSPGMVRVASRRHPGVEFRVADMRDLPFAPGSFDGLVAAFSLIHVPKAQVPATLRGFARVLAPRGAALLVMQEGRSEERYLGGDLLMNIVTFEELQGLLGGAGFLLVATHVRDPRADELPFRKRCALARRGA